jgi:hypothetical protein
LLYILYLEKRGAWVGRLVGWVVGVWASLICVVVVAPWPSFCVCVCSAGIFSPLCVRARYQISTAHCFAGRVLVGMRARHDQIHTYIHTYYSSRFGRVSQIPLVFWCGGGEAPRRPPCRAHVMCTFTLGVCRPLPCSSVVVVPTWNSVSRRRFRRRTVGRGSTSVYSAPG